MCMHALILRYLLLNITIKVNSSPFRILLIPTMAIGTIRATIRQPIVFLVGVL